MVSGQRHRAIDHIFQDIGIQAAIRKKRHKKTQMMITRRGRNRKSPMVLSAKAGN